MKIRRETVIGLAVLVIFAAGLTFFLNVRKSWVRNDTALRIAEISGRGGPPETIEGLRNALALYEKRIEAHVRDAAQTGVYWKILAIRLQDRGLHLEALEALEQAMKYNAEDPSLRYLAGISAARVAKGTADMIGGDQRGRYYALSESAFLTAIGLDETYSRPRYALGVLYTFDLDRPEDAIPHLLRFLELTINDVDGMFVLARAYYMTSQYREALELYDRILKIVKDSDKKKEAERNKQHIMEVYYG
ncbi:MAG: tetratricopeptide repeat protein [Treponema sp.]|jgi:tetratricopeptide (TPR) repeat protein|nr:tetratricopeptide repeat protein [Treponema sp.]